MSQLEPLFGFERSAVRIHKGVIPPLQEAINRWVGHVRTAQEALAGPCFKILYELTDGRFVMLDYIWCRLEKEVRGDITVEIWNSHVPPTGSEIAAIDALAFLIDLQEEIPPSLTELLRTEQAKREKPKIPRDLSYWAEKTYLGYERETPAHEEQPLVIAQRTINGATAFVHLVRACVTVHTPTRIFGAS